MCDFDDEDDSWMRPDESEPPDNLNNAMGNDTLCQFDLSFNEMDQGTSVNDPKIDLNMGLTNTTLDQFDLTFEDPDVQNLNEACFGTISDLTLENMEVEFSEGDKQAELNTNSEGDKRAELSNNSEGDKKAELNTNSEEAKQAELNLDQLISALDEPLDEGSVAKSNQSQLVEKLKRCCPKSTRKMDFHLNTSDACKKDMTRLLGIEPNSSVSEIMVERKKALRRLVYYRKYNENRRTTRLNMSNLEKLRECKKKIGKIHRVYICYSCNFTSIKKSHFLESVPDKVLPKSFETDSTYFLCIPCQGKLGQGSTTIRLEKRNFLKITSIEERNVLTPNQTPDKSCHLKFPPSLFLLVNFPSKDLWCSENLAKPRSDLLTLSNENVALAKDAVSVNDFADAIFEHRLQAIQNRRAEGSFYKGKVVSIDDRLVKTNPLKPDLSRIKGTMDYNRKLFIETQAYFAYFGRTAISLQVELKKDCLEIWKQVLVQENKVAIVSSEINGDLSYKVHTNHRSFEPCVEECKDIDLRDYLNSQNLFDHHLEEPKYIPLVCDHYRKLFNGFTSYICNLEEIRSEKYVSSIHFPINGEPILKMIIWPKFLENFNQKLSTDDPVSLSDVRILETKFDNVFSTVIESDESSQVEKRLNELVKTELFDSIMGSIPSNANLIKRPTIPRGNSWGLSEVTSTTENLFLLQTYFLEILNSVEKEYFDIDSDAKLDDLFEVLQTYDGFECKMTENKFTIKFPGKEIVECFIDEVLFQLLTQDKYPVLSAIYHRAMTICRSYDDFTLVVKRPNLRSCYVPAYNPDVLLLGGGKCFISYIASDISGACRDFAIPSKPNYPSEQQYLIDHEEMSLVNGFFLVGGKQFNLKNRSTVPFYYDPGLDKQQTYKKVTEFDENKHFKDINSSHWLEMLPDIYSHYLDRQGNERLNFMQFCMYYQQSGKDESEEIIEDRPDVQNTDVPLISFDGCRNIEVLPQVIELGSGKKLLLQKKPKLVYHPFVDVDSEKFRELSVMFYYPHNDRAHLELFGIEQIFYAKSDNVPGKSKIEVTRNLLHPFFSLDLYHVMCNSL